MPGFKSAMLGEEFNNKVAYIGELIGILESEFKNDFFYNPADVTWDNAIADLDDIAWSLRRILAHNIIRPKGEKE